MSRCFVRTASTITSFRAIKNTSIRIRLAQKPPARYVRTVPAGESVTIRLRFSQDTHKSQPFADYDAIFDQRVREADDFYDQLQANVTDPELRIIQRQAYAGMLWNKQFYYYNVNEWLKGDPKMPTPFHGRAYQRNSGWRHMYTANILSMPDKWEYPWFAAWDLAFHTLTLARLDPHFAKRQLAVILREYYMHPNGQIPAYEWNFGDVNPPVHAWATWKVYEIDRDMNGKGDINFLERVFHKLLLNFTWWVNRKDVSGNSVFGGGFLGLDNIGVFDRSQPLPMGGHIEQADGTGWMAMYTLNMLRDCLRNCADPAHLPGHGLEVFRALPAHCGCHEKIWADQGHQPLGRGRSVLLRRAAHARQRQYAVENSLDGGPDSALCRRNSG